MASSEPGMEGGIAHHHAHVVGVHEQHLLHHRRECAAGLAGRIEELDDGHGRIRAPEHG